MFYTIIFYLRLTLAWYWSVGIIGCVTMWFCELIAASKFLKVEFGRVWRLALVPGYYPMIDNKIDVMWFIDWPLRVIHEIRYQAFLHKVETVCMEETRMEEWTKILM